MKLSRRIFNIICLLLLCIAQTGCSLLAMPFDLLGAAVGSAVGIGAQAAQLGVAAAPYAAPFFM